MSNTLIWTPRGHVEPAAALSAFIDRTGCMAQELLVILEELWKKAAAFARRACIYVLNTDTNCYPADVVRRAQYIMKKVTQSKPREPKEMVLHLEECLKQVVLSNKKTSQAIVTFSEAATTRDMQELLSSPYVTFPSKSMQTALIAATVKKNWLFTENPVTVTVKVCDNYTASKITDTLIKVATDFELV